MKLRRIVRIATFAWGAYRLYRRSRHNVRVRTRHALRQAARRV